MLSGSMILVSLSLVAVFKLILYEAIKKDLVVLLRKLVVKVTGKIAFRRLCAVDAGEFMDWVNADIAEMVDHGGSGLLLAFRFLGSTLPREIWHKRAVSQR